MTEQSAHIAYYRLFLVKQPAGILRIWLFLFASFEAGKGISSMFKTFVFVFVLALLAYLASDNVIIGFSVWIVFGLLLIADNTRI